MSDEEYFILRDVLYKDFQEGFISESEYRQELNYLEDWYYYSDIDCSPYKLY